jgi:hypothetical protein
MNYRFVIRDPAGQHPCLVEIPLEDDETAVELARGFITATACEIWQDDRIVEVMRPLAMRVGAIGSASSVQ